MKFIEISRDIVLSPLFENTVVEILFAFDIARSVALGSEGGKEYSLIWISEFCLKDDESVAFYYISIPAKHLSKGWE
jgi:hypothetical protein